jgi:hypothetical protein
MRQRFILFRRKVGGMFYVEDTETQKQGKSEGKEQRLRLVFATHEVSPRGNSLRRIETAMQRSELSLLTGLSGKQRSLIPDGEPVVVEIVVTEMESQPKRDEDTHSALQ